MLDYYREVLKAPPKPNVEPQQTYAEGYEPIELWSRRLADARLDAAANAEERVSILAGEVERIRKFSGDIKEIANTQNEWRSVADRVEFYELDAEYRLAKEKAGR
jgi:hypothetical protein